VFLDFVDFSGFDDVNIDYRLPWILHVKNEDFNHLIKYDRKKTKSHSFGFLPVSLLLSKLSMFSLFLFKFFFQVYLFLFVY
jgi:hypothetical protein